MPLPIETERLILREFSLDDAQAVLEFSGNEQVTRYTGDAGQMTDINKAKWVIENVWLAGYREHGFARWAMVHKADNRVIGFCGIKMEPRINDVDIGYRMLPEYWGQGLASEAMSATLEYVKQHFELPYLIAEVVKENYASKAIIEKFGFEFENEYQDLGFTVLRYKLEL